MFDASKVINRVSACSEYKPTILCSTVSWTSG